MHLSERPLGQQRTQRLIGLGVNDATLLDAVVGEYGEALDAARGLERGAWGVGLLGSGELLVRKCPLSPRFDGLRYLRGLHARHLAIIGDGEASVPFRPDAAQPLRFRDWLCAVTGGLALGQPFIDAVDEQLDGFVARAVRTGTVAEAVMVTLMDALYRANTLDVRSFTRELVHQALALGVQRIAELAGGRERLDMAILVHAGPRLFALSAGRPLALVRGPSRRGGNGRVEGVARQAHLRIALVTDDVDLEGAEPVPAWSGVEIPEDCAVIPFAL